MRDVGMGPGPRPPHVARHDGNLQGPGPGLTLAAKYPVIAMNLNAQLAQGKKKKK